MRLTDEVRAHCAEIAAGARSVQIVAERLEASTPPLAEPPGPEHHFIEGSREEVARFVLCLTTINFGSGWWPTIRKRAGLSGYYTMATGLTARFRGDGPWTNAELRRIHASELATVLQQEPGHELMSLYAGALRQLGTWMGERSATQVIDEAGGSAELLAEQLAAGMAYYDDRGFYKRAQLASSEFELFGVARFNDLERLTIFADNLVPHVLRVDGALVYSEPLSEAIAAERLLPSGSWEREIRGCAVHAVEQLSAKTGISARELDHALWARGGEPRYKAEPRHRHRTVFY